MPIKGKQIVDNTVTQQQLGITTETVVNQTDVTTKGYVDQIVNSAVTGLVHTDIDYNLTALNTSGTAQTLAVDHPISKEPVGGVRVYVNGIEINVGPGQASFFAKYQLDSTDEIDFIYRTYSDDYPL